MEKEIYSMEEKSSKIKLIVVSIIVLIILLFGAYSFQHKNARAVTTGLAISPASSSGDLSSDQSFKSNSLTATDAATAHLKQTQEYNDLILNIIQLRAYHLNSSTIRTAEKVTEIDQSITTLDNSKINDKWDSITLCLANRCNDADFFDFILIISLEEQINASSNIVNILTAEKYWNTDNTVKFSEAITLANQQIDTIHNAAISAKWDEITACKSKCANKNELYFSIIKLLAEQ